MGKKKLKRRIKALEGRVALAEQRLVTAYNEAMRVQALENKVEDALRRVAALEGRPTITWKASHPSGVTFVPSVLDKYGTAVPAQFKGVT